MLTSPESCYSLQSFGDHTTVVVYIRPWWNFFRKTHEICCWYCDLSVMEPRK